MKQMPNIEFEILLQNATVEKFCGSEYTIFNDSHDEFYFYYNASTEKITDQGDLKISGEQYEKICDLAHGQFTQDLNDEDENENLEPITDYYKEFGLSPNMFLKV